jgi:diacylglycerol kinase (ATP)
MRRDARAPNRGSTRSLEAADQSQRIPKADSPELRRKSLIKITLIDNPGAGTDSRPAGDKIVKLIRAAGHKVRYQSSKEKKWKKALKKSCDIVAIAGGDGTVDKVARELIGSRAPIAVLPLGTANNIAHTLEVTGIPLEDLIDGWKTGRCVNFDAALAKGPWESRHFIEGFGVGLFADTMARLQKADKFDLPDSDAPKTIIRSVLTTLKTELKNYSAAPMVVQLDGKDLSGDYVLLEALNIRYIGPNLDLVPRADINDGSLDVVLVSERERTKLSKYLSDLLNGKKSRANLTVRRGQHLQIEWKNSPIHIDDTPWPNGKKRTELRSNAIDINIEPGALVFLTPAETRRRQPKRRS